MARYIECDNCGAKDDGSEPFNGQLTKIKGEALIRDSHFAFTLEICDKCQEELFEKFPKLKASTELF